MFVIHRPDKFKERTYGFYNLDIDDFVTKYMHCKTNSTSRVGVNRRSARRTWVYLTTSVRIYIVYFRYIRQNRLHTSVAYVQVISSLIGHLFFLIMKTMNKKQYINNIYYYTLCLSATVNQIRIVNLRFTKHAI